MIKRLSHSKEFWIYLACAAAFIGLLFCGLYANISASTTKTYPLYSSAQLQRPFRLHRAHRPVRVQQPAQVRPVRRHARRNVQLASLRQQKPAQTPAAQVTRPVRVHRRHRRQPAANVTKPAVRRPVQRPRSANRAWFTDGLSNANLRARGWITRHESGNNWRIVSYGGRCIGYFQLDPAYLGYRHGHVNLNRRHQVRVADHYAATRYGDWLHAQAFWSVHHWY